MKKLDAYEKDILNSYKKGELKSTSPSKAKLAKFKAAATATKVYNRAIVVLDAEVFAVFPNSGAVNKALRFLMNVAKKASIKYTNEPIKAKLIRDFLPPSKALRFLKVSGRTGRSPQKQRAGKGKTLR